MSDHVFFDRIAIFGVGLMGGAVALQIKKNGLAGSIAGIGRNEESLKKAVEAGLIDEWSLDFEESAGNCNLLILALPVSSILEYLPKAAGVVKPGCIVTDIGSVKKDIVKTGNEAFSKRKDAWFAGSHPLCGSDLSGFENSSSVPMENRTCFVTIDDDTEQESAAKVALFWKSLGMTPFLMAPEKHDILMAAFSHMPHLMAAALVNASGKCTDYDMNLLARSAGDGFRDATRIAGSDAALWSDICLRNTENLTECLEKLEDEIKMIRNALETGDEETMKDLLQSARTFRTLIDKLS